MEVSKMSSDDHLELAPHSQANSSTENVQKAFYDSVDSFPFHFHGG